MKPAAVFLAVAVACAVCPAHSFGFNPFHRHRHHAPHRHQHHHHFPHHHHRHFNLPSAFPSGGPTTRISQTHEGGWRLHVHTPWHRNWAVQRDGEILQVHELLPNGFSRNYQLPADTDVERIRWWWEKSPVQGRDKLIVDMPKVAKMAADVPGSGECAMPTAAEAPSTTDRQQKHARDLVLLATQKKRAPTAARHQERVRALAAERRRVEEERRRMEEERAAHQAAAARHEQRSRALAAEQQRLEQERLEQEAMAEAIAEKRGARDQPGVREEWASTAHLHKRYDTGRPRRSQPPLGSQGDAAATVPPKPAPWSSDDGLADDKSSNIGSNDHPEALHSPPKKDDGMMMTPPHRLEAFHIGRTATRPRHASSF